MRALRHGHRRRLALHRLLRDGAENFVDFIGMAFLAEDGTSRAGITQDMATTAYVVLDSWNALPGLAPDGRLDRDAFLAWAADVRRLAAASSRREVCDVVLGQACGRAAGEPGGVWPPLPVRELLDRPDAANLRRGFRTGVFNKRGMVTKAIYEGGAQERALVERYRALSEELALEYPRLAQTVREIAEGYRREAEAADQQAALSERWER